MKKCLLGLVLAVACSTAQAAVPASDVATDVRGLPMWNSGLSLLPGNCTLPVESTGWELADGFDTAFLCGSAFAGCVEPVTVLTCVAPGPTENCCGDYPNAANCWFTSSASWSCTVPEISTVNPYAGAQHLRMRADASGGGSHQAFTPLQGLDAPGQTHMEFMLYGSAGAGSELRFRAFDDNATGVSGAFAAYMFFDTTGGTNNIYINDYNLPSATRKVFVGYWTPGVYKKVEVDISPCREMGFTQTYKYGGAVIYTHSTVTYPSTVERANWLFLPNSGTKYFDVDNYAITRGALCLPAVCGDGFVDAPETCEPGVPSATCPPGRCILPGLPGQCTCLQICTLNDPCWLVNGDNGPYVPPCDPGYGCIFLYVADTENVSINTCGSNWDTKITYWGSAADPNDYGNANDDCETPINSYTYGSDPTAPCYNNDDYYQSCTCHNLPAAGDNLYLAQLLQSGNTLPPNGVTTMIEINKKFECGEGGRCPNSCNGTCGTAGTCTVGTCDTTPVPDVCQGVCIAGRIQELCKGDDTCDVPIVPGHCDLLTFLCDAGMVGLPCPGGLDAECDVPGIEGICMGLCQASQIACEGDIMCPPVAPFVCLTGPRIGEPCTTNAQCNECTAPAAAVGANCAVNADCRRCTVGLVGAACTASAQCLACTRGPHIGTVCTVANQDTTCGGKFCSLGDIGALCIADADCDVGEVIPGGACCDGVTGVCTDGAAMTPEACAAISDQAVYTPNKTCDLVGACIRHTGACCDGTPEAVHCTGGTYPEACVGANKTWWKGAACDPDPCPALTLGACCNTLTGGCTPNMVLADCSGPQRVFTLDHTCANVTCDAVLGACCDKDTFGGCTDVTQAECTCAKCEWSKLASCANIECTHEAIPTVSQWGLVVLTLLLLVGAKVYFGRRQSAAA